MVLEEKQLAEMRNDVFKPIYSYAVATMLVLFIFIHIVNISFEKKNDYTIIIIQNQNGIQNYKYFLT